RALHGSLRARGLQTSAGAAAVLAGPAVRANNSDLRAVRHAELAHDLPDMSFDRTFPHPQPARNNLVRVASTQEFEDRLLPRCWTANSRRILQIFCSAVVPIRVASARLLPRCWTAISRFVFPIFCSAVVPVHDTRRGGDAIDRRMPLRPSSFLLPHRRRKTSAVEDEREDMCRELSVRSYIEESLRRNIQC